MSFADSNTQSKDAATNVSIKLIVEPFLSNVKLASTRLPVSVELETP